MRTYNRKRPELHEIEGALELCRLCLEKPEEWMPLFPDNSDNQCSVLALRIMICVGLEMTKENSLPNLICMTCYNELERYHSFRRKCEISYQKLKSHVLAVKEKEYNKEAERKKQKIEENVMFTVNLDGTIRFCGDNSPKSEMSILPLLTEPSKPQTMPTDDTICLKEMLTTDNIEVDASKEKVATSTSLPIEKEIILETEKSPAQAAAIPVQDDTNTITSEQNTQYMEISNFLSSMLLELGVVTTNDEQLVLQNDTRTLDIEAGDGSQITFQLIEEDEETSETPVELVENNKEVAKIEVPVKQNLSKSRRSKKGKKYVIKGQAWCSICRKVFGTRSVYARHMRDVHSGVRPHVCDICGKRFAQRSVLVRHKLIHEEKRPYQCSECPKSFTQRASLEGHARVHVPPESRALAIYQCPKCPKVFLYSSGLSRHMLMHTSKFFQCSGCNRAFKDKSSLLRHMKVMKHEQLTELQDVTDTQHRIVAKTISINESNDMYSFCKA